MDTSTGPDFTIDTDVIIETCGDRPLPEVGVVEQVWETDAIPLDEVASVAASEVGNFDLAHLPEGGTVAVGAGSRGIVNIDEIVRGTVMGLQERGYEPFIFPAMGSHGGASAAAQREKLESYGITESAMGCELRATMEVVEVGRTPERDVPVYADANAVAADAIVPVNRVKPHTSFGAEVESGLSKMLVIGMGKQKGARMAHEWAHDWGLGSMIPEIASLLLAELPIVGGMATVENQRHETAIIEGVSPAGFLTREAELLETAYELLARVPFEAVDVLVIDQMGKDISGAGMDPNVLGTAPGVGGVPEVERVFTRSLTDETRGNAAGISQANFIHQDLYRALDIEKTTINALTASNGGLPIPTVVESDRGGLIAACATVGVVGPEDLRLVRITDTQRLPRFYASAALIEEARDRDDLVVTHEPEPIEFDEAGNLVAPSPAFADPAPTP